MDDAVRERARELCEQAGLDPDTWATVGYDAHGSIREQNWEMFVDEAQAQD